MDIGLAPDQSHPTFAVMQRQAQFAESLGFSALWAHEHHSKAMMYPDPLMTLAALVPVTRTIKLGTSMLLLPIHHPVRVAQAVAMLDVMSEGRVCLGVTNGYSATDLKAFGMDHSHRGKRLSEGIRLIRALWQNDTVSAKGDGFALDGFELFPKPVQRPGPPIYIGGHADIAVRRAAELGDNYFISTTCAFEQVDTLIKCYRSFMKEFCKPFEGVFLNRIVCVTGTKKQTSEAEAFYARALLRLYGSWGHDNIAGLSEQQRSIEHISRHQLIIGDASACYDKILEYQALGVKHIACLTNFGSPPLEIVERSIKLLGEKVLPRLTQSGYE